MKIAKRVQGVSVQNVLGLVSFRRAGSPAWKRYLPLPEHGRTGEVMRIRFSAFAALLVTSWPGVMASQAPVSGTFAPAGPPERPPVRVDAGGACVIDLVQDYTIDGALTGEVTFDYRILVAGPCGSPAGTYDEEWIAHGTFSGTASGQNTTASVLYTARVRAGGSVSGTVTFRGAVEAELEIAGEFADRRLSYNGTAKLSRDGGR